MTVTAEPVAPVDPWATTLHPTARRRGSHATDTVIRRQVLDDFRAIKWPALVVTVAAIPAVLAGLLLHM